MHQNTLRSIEVRFNRNSLFGIPTPESIHPLVSNRALSVRRLSRRRPERRSPASCKDRTAALIACSTSFSDTAASRRSFRPVSYHGGVYVTPWERATLRFGVRWPRRVAASNDSRPAAASSTGRAGSIGRPDPRHPERSSWDPPSPELASPVRRPKALPSRATEHQENAVAASALRAALSLMHYAKQDQPACPMPREPVPAFAGSSWPDIPQSAIDGVFA